ncbi:ArsR/SmtB family transcription factor [Homoserinimonas sp. A447]
MVESSLPIAQVKAELFRALAHPVRVRALELLVQAERSVGELAAALDVDLSHLSQQLAVLRRSDVVVTRRDGNTIYYSVQNPGIAALLATARELIVASLQTSSSLLAALEVGEEQKQ